MRAFYTGWYNELAVGLPVVPQRRGVDAGYALTWAGASVATFTDAQSLHMGQLAEAPTTTSGRNRLHIPYGGTIIGANVWSVFGTFGTTETWNMYVRLNGTTDTLIGAASAANPYRRWTNYALSIAVSQGDYVEIKSVNPTWATNPATGLFGGVVLVRL